MKLFGRRKIYTSSQALTPENVIQEVNAALAIHSTNMGEMEYLYDYARGIQPILRREKEIRPEINNKVVVNNAAMVVTFKNGYFLTKPATYVPRKDDETVANKVKELNEYLYTSGKHEADNMVVNDFHTMGIGIIYVEPNRDEDPDKPVNVYALNPRSAFVVYSQAPGNKPVFAVNIVTDGEKIVCDVFTQNLIFKCFGRLKPKPNVSTVGNVYAAVTTVESVTANAIGDIPIIEYAYNRNRMSAFEAAIPLMDAINTAESNRLDGIEQTIQSLMVTWNCQFDDGITANKIRQYGMVNLMSNGENRQDLKILNETLDQQQTQTTINNLYEQMLEKCGVPSSVRDGGSTSDNVGAVYLRSGWAMADTDARNTEDSFKESNKRFDKIFLNILNAKCGFSLLPSDYELCFVRNDMSNLLVKTQAAMNMKELGFAPEIAFERSGLSNDPVGDVERSREYIDAKWSTESPMVNQMMVGTPQDAQLTDEGPDNGQDGEQNAESDAV